MAINLVVADDSQIMRRMIIKAIHMGGLPIGEIYEAADGKAALKAISENPVSLALLDINMPELNGILVLDTLRQSPHTKSLPVLMISTEGSEPKQAYIKSQKASFLRKPFTPESLVEAIISALKGAQ